VGETPQLLPTLRGLYRFYHGRGAFPTAWGIGEQIAQLAQRETDPIQRLEAHDALGNTLFQMGDYTAARTHLEQGIALTEPTVERTMALRHGLAPGGRCLNAAALTLWCLGAPAQAVRRIEEALAHPYSLAAAQPWAAWLHHCRRDVPAVQAQAEALLPLATAQGFPLHVGTGLCWRGGALAMQGEGEMGLAQLRQGLAAVVDLGQELGRSLCLVLLAEAVGHADQVEEGLHLLAEARTVLEANGQPTSRRRRPCWKRFPEPYRHVALHDRFTMRQVGRPSCAPASSVSRAMIATTASRSMAMPEIWRLPGAGALWGSMAAW
jgi:tetratricopeptide (TPR) repeat protein